MKQFTQYQSVQVIDETLERHGQVGSYIGMDGADYNLKFDDGKIESFEADSIKGLF